MEPVDILLFWDFDLTMSEEYQQLPLFRHYWNSLQAAATTEGLDVSEPEDLIERFTRMPGSYGVSYLSRILRDNAAGLFGDGLTENELFTLGEEIKAAPGLSKGLWALQERFRERARIHHRIVTVGIKRMVEGFLAAQGIKDFVEDVAGSSFLTKKDGVIDGLHTVVLPGSKYEWVYSAIKGGVHSLNDVVDARMLTYDPRNAFILGDGETDTPVISFGKMLGATSVGVYGRSEEAFRKAQEAIGKRADVLLPRDYTPRSLSHELLVRMIEEKLSRRCDEMSPRYLDAYRRQEKAPPDVIQAIERHLDGDGQSPGCDDCRRFFLKRTIDPAGNLTEREARSIYTIPDGRA